MRDTSTGDHRIILGEGPENARVMLIGQNPGREEIKLGRPFVGRSGKYLDSVLKANNIPRAELFITSVVKEATPANRRPTQKEIACWMPVLIGQIKRLRPQIIVLMGKVAWQTPRFEGILYIETFHPAAAMRFPKARRRFEADFKMVAERIGDIARQHPAKIT